MDVRIGCSGWSYKDWSGPFYPKELQPKEYLAYYSKFSNTVEIDSSYYRIPAKSLISVWKQVTPGEFVFTAKFPQDLVKKLNLEGLEAKLGYFYSVMNGLSGKLGPLLIQLPPFIRFKKLDPLSKFLDGLDSHFKHAIEFRHESWFNKDVYRELEERDVILCWSTNQYLDTPPILTGDTVYLRMVGDRSITKFDKVQKDQSKKMMQWRDALKSAKSADGGFVFFNNHFAGFGPESVNEFRRLMGMMEVEWTEMTGQPTQSSLTDF